MLSNILSRVAIPKKNDPPNPVVFDISQFVQKITKIYKKILFSSADLSGADLSSFTIVDDSAYACLDLN